MRNKELPVDWDDQRVQQVIAHYECQTEAEAADEDERALEDASQTVMEIPRELVPAVRELIARHQARPA